MVGILIVALKVSIGCGLANLNRREILCIATLYFVLSLAMGLFLELVPENILNSALDFGVAMHLVIALLLVGLGVITAKEWNKHRHDISRKTFWILAVPCPACLAATFLSCTALVALLEISSWKVGLAVGLIFFLSVNLLSNLVGHVKKAPSALGSAMIFIGLFYILSILLIPAYLKSTSTPFAPVVIPSSDLIVSYLFILALVALGFSSRRMGVLSL